MESKSQKTKRWGMSKALAMLVVATYRVEKNDRSGECYKRFGQMIPEPRRLTDCIAYAGKLFREIRKELDRMGLKPVEQQRLRVEATRLFSSVPWGSPDMYELVEEAKRQSEQ